MPPCDQALRLQIAGKSQITIKNLTFLVSKDGKESNGVINLTIGLYDNTDLEAKMYKERFEEIGREMLYLFSNVNEG